METVLLVDDDPQVLAMVHDVLEMNGYAVLDADGGDAALRVEEEHPDTIHLLLTDIMMPGLTGPEVARQLSARRPKMKVLYMSAFTVVDFTNQRIELEPGVPILAKPFAVEALTKKVRELLAPSFFARPPRADAARA